MAVLCNNCKVVGLRATCGVQVTRFACCVCCGTDFIVKGDGNARRDYSTLEAARESLMISIDRNMGRIDGNGFSIIEDCGALSSLQDRRRS